MLEKTVEAYLVTQVQKMDGIAYKFTSPNRRSVPDRLVVLPDSRLFFVECKSTDGKLTPGQTREIKRLRDMGQVVYIVASVTEIMEVLAIWRT